MRVSLTDDERRELIDLVTREAKSLSHRRWWRPLIGDVSKTLDRLNCLQTLRGKLMSPVAGAAPVNYQVGGGPVHLGGVDLGNIVSMEFVDREPDAVVSDVPRVVRRRPR